MNIIKETGLVQRAVISVITIILITLGFYAKSVQVFAADDKTPLGANQIKLNQDVTGETYTKTSEYKYYKFTTKSEAGIKYSIKMINTGDNSIVAYLYNNDLQIVSPTGGTYCLFGGDFGPRAGEWYTPVFDLARNKEYYVGISCSSYGKPSSFSFFVKAKVQKPSKVFLNKVTGKRKSIKITWHKTYLADKYEVSIKKQGGSWKSYTSSKTAKTINGLKSNRKYTIRVRGVREYNGKEYKGKWSDKKSVVIK